MKLLLGVVLGIRALEIHFNFTNNIGTIAVIIYFYINDNSNTQTGASTNPKTLELNKNLNLINTFLGLLI